MTATTFDIPDWESQMAEMLGDDAPDMVRRFTQIINEHVESLDEPVAILEVAASEDDIHKWLPAVHGFLTETDEYDDEAFRELVQTLGFELSRTYLFNDDVEQDDACSATSEFFWGTLDDEDEDDNDDD